MLQKLYRCGENFCTHLAHKWSWSSVEYVMFLEAMPRSILFVTSITVVGCIICISPWMLHYMKLWRKLLTKFQSSICFDSFLLFNLTAVLWSQEDPLIFCILCRLTVTQTLLKLTIWRHLHYAIKTDTSHLSKSCIFSPVHLCHVLPVSDYFLFWNLCGTKSTYKMLWIVFWTHGWQLFYIINIYLFLGSIFISLLTENACFNFWII